MRLVKWVKENIVKKETHAYEVYYIYNKSIIISLSEVAKSKVEARKQSSTFIKNNAAPGNKYKFLKVEKIK